MKALVLFALAVQGSFSWNLPRNLGLDDIATRYVAEFGHVAAAVDKPDFRSLPVETKGESLGDVGERVRKRLSLAPGRFGGFSTMAWPGYVVVRQDTTHHPHPDGEASSLKGLKVGNGYLSGRTEPGRFMELGRINELGFSRPIHWHWFYGAARIHLVCSGASEAEILASVAEALGARLTITDKEYDLQPDPRQFRERLMATYAEQAARGNLDRFTQAKYRVAAMALRDAKDEDVAKL